MRVLALAAACTLVLAAGCAPGAGSSHSSPFNRMLAKERMQLAPVIEYDAFIAVCERHLLLDHEGFLKSSGIKVRGSGSGRYIPGHELLTACGPDCTPGHGLGAILQEFAVDRSK